MDLLTPEFLKTAIPPRWLPHSRFNHGVHRVLSCRECHGKAEQSTRTADVLLPRMNTCRECHRLTDGARTGCVECHVYHDKKRETFDGPRKLPELRTDARALTGSGTPESTAASAELLRLVRGLEPEGR
jgi:hypothetical protein